MGDEQAASDVFFAAASPVLPHSHSVLCLAPIPCSSLPRTEPRPIDVPAPALLRNVLSRYDANVSFEWAHGWTWLSEDEIRTRRDEFVARGQLRIVDLGFRYMGMGHVMVLSYDPVAERVFEMRDGGSNGFDRHAHHEARVHCAVDDLVTEPFDEWVRRTLSE